MSRKYPILQGGISLVTVGIVAVYGYIARSDQDLIQQGTDSQNTSLERFREESRGVYIDLLDQAAGPDAVFDRAEKVKLARDLGYTGLIDGEQPIDLSSDADGITLRNGPYTHGIPTDAARKLLKPESERDHSAPRGEGE